MLEEKKHFSTYEFSSVQCHFTWIYYWQHNIRHKTWEKFPLENNLPKMAILILKIFQSFLGKCRKFKNIFFKCVFFYICTFYHLVAHLLTDIQFVKINIRVHINIYDPAGTSKTIQQTLQNEGLIFILPASIIFRPWTWPWAWWLIKTLNLIWVSF